MLSAPALALLPALLAQSPEPDAAQRRSFAAFVKRVKKEAKAKTLKPETLAVLDTLSPLLEVIKRDRSQPHSTMTFERYLEIILSDKRIAGGRTLLAKEEALLAATAERYGVQKELLVALWGVESRYGEVMGDFPVPGALATLAWEGRRRRFFTRELLHALTILDQGHITAEKMKGSWAGAMGQCQFMPSTFTTYAADGDGDGRRDIWGTRADVFASAANYLMKLGWAKGQRWGREVTLPEGLDAKDFGFKEAKTLAEWRKLGLKTQDGGALEDEAPRAWLLRPDGDKGPAVLAYPNFRVLMKWNRSQYFAAGVGMLADRIAAPPEQVAAPATKAK